jgi:hypothetical protein
LEKKFQSKMKWADITMHVNLRASNSEERLEDAEERGPGFKSFQEVLVD